MLRPRSRAPSPTAAPTASSTHRSTFLPTFLTGLLVGSVGPFVLASCSLKSGEDPAPDRGEFREEAREIAADIRAAIEEDGRGGATLGVFLGEEAAFAEGFGLADMEAGTPARADGAYRIGSITKPVTAMAFLRLVSLGRMQLGEPLTRRVPEVFATPSPFPWAQEPTLFQMATMTGGMSREPEDLPRYLVGAPEDWLEVALRAAAAASFEFEPGTRYQYSNIGYALLGVAVERAAERPFIEETTEALLEPLGMDSSAFRPTDAIRDRIASGYQITDEGEVDAENPAREHEGRGYKVPNGALYSTVFDLNRFLRFLTGTSTPAFDAVIPAEVRKENLETVVATGRLDRGYGVGFMTRRLTRPDGSSFAAFGHGGGVAGYRAAAWIEPESGVSVALLRNVGGDGVSVGDLALDALAKLVPAPPPPEDDEEDDRRDIDEDLLLILFLVFLSSGAFIVIMLTD